jgi:reverse gyrase
MASPNKPANDEIVDEVRKYREALLEQSGGDIHLVAEEMRTYSAASGRKSVSLREVRELRTNRK